MDARAMMVLLATVILLALSGCSAAPSPTPVTATADDFTVFYADENITGEVAVTVAGKVTGDGAGDGGDGVDSDDGDDGVDGDAGEHVIDGVGENTVALQLQLRLRNHGESAVELAESTRCTVLRWTIIDARGNPVQTMTDRRCAQQLATRTLHPAQTIHHARQIPLPAARGRYTVRFTFWTYPGEHAFEAR